MLKEEMRYDPGRREPVRPPTFKHFKDMHDFDEESKTGCCPECHGKGELPDPEDTRFLQVCTYCDGTGRVNYGVLKMVYHDMYTKYVKEYADWDHYVQVLTAIKRKLTHRDKSFLGITDHIGEGRPRPDLRKDLNE